MSSRLDGPSENNGRYEVHEAPKNGRVLTAVPKSVDAGEEEIPPYH